MSAAENLIPRSATLAIRAEQTLLGAILQDSRRMDDIADGLCDADFYDERHRLIWRAMTKLFKASKPIDFSTVDEQLKRDGIKLDQFEYLVRLVKNSTGGSNVKHYADTVKNASLERDLVRVGNEIAELATQPVGSVQEKLLRANALVSDLTNVRVQKEPKKISELLPAFYDSMESRLNKKGVIVGLSTGYAELDEMTAGLCNGDLIIVAGRPSMGKTAFAMNIAENVALDEKTVLIFSMEMSDLKLVDRSIASVGRVEYQAIRTGAMSDEQWGRAGAAIGRLSEIPLYIDDSPGLSTMELRLRARRQHRKTPLSLIVIDYLQLMKGEGKSRYDQITNISNDLKALARELNVPVIALSQLSRGVDSRADKRPVLSDLRESGAIEQDADVVIFMFREDYYDKASQNKGLALAIIAKQRDGQTGDVVLKFNGNRMRFEDFDGCMVQPATKAPTTWDRGFE